MIHHTKNVMLTNVTGINAVDREAQCTASEKVTLTYWCINNTRKYDTVGESTVVMVRAGVERMWGGDPCNRPRWFANDIEAIEYKGNRYE